jgi:hypothetical protein
MRDDHGRNFAWAQENGYQFHAETQGSAYETARNLDVFRKADGFYEHVLGIYRNRAFEVLDVRKSVRHGDTFGFVRETVVLVPTDGIDLPNFELVPRSAKAALSFLGLDGLDLRISDSAPRDERELVDEFNKHYGLFGGGTFEAIEASIKSADHLVPSLADMATICKPGVLRFLPRIKAGFIEVQDGFLAVRAPETRIIRAAFADTILVGRERESLLNVANDLLDVLRNAANEAPLRGLTLENNLNPTRLIGGLIGAAVGFFLGIFIGILLLFIFGKKFLLLIPVLALGGAGLGNFLGKKLLGSK